MRRLKTIFACMLMAIFSVGQVWADDVADKLTSSDLAATSTTYTDFSNVSKTSDAKYAGNSAKSSGGGIQLRSKNSNSGIVSTISGGTVKSVKITVESGSNTVDVYGSNTAYTAASNLYAAGTQGTKVGSLSATGTINFTDEYAYVGIRSNNGALYLTEVEITWTSGGGDPDPVSVTGVTLDKSAAEVAVGKTITLVPTVAPSNATNKAVSWGTDDDDIATVADGVVTGVAEGTTTITVTTEDGSFTANCEVTVTPAPAAVNYEKVTAAPTDWSGEYLIVYENGANAYVWTGVDAASCYATATISNDVIAQPEGTSSVTIASMEGGYSILVNGGTNDGKYIQNNGTSNGIKFVNAGVATTLTYENNAVTITCGGKMFRYNNASGNDRFRYFGSAQQVIQLYKKVDGSVLPSAELAFADANHLVKVGASFTAPTLTNPYSVDVTYASSDADVVAVSADGATVTIKAAGKAEITASFAGNGSYKAGSAKYTIYVAAQAGTAEDPLTEASAKALIDLGCTMNAHVAGIVVTPTYYSSSQTYTVTLSDGFQFYKLKDLGNELFTSDYLKAGDQLVVLGPLGKHNTTYQLGDGCYLISYVEYTAPKTPIVSDIDNPITVAAAIGYINDPITYDLSGDVWVRGVVTSIGQTSGASPIPYIDVKDADAENSFRFFNYTINGSITEEPQEYDILIATGKLDKHYDTYELNGCEVVSLVRPDVAVESVSLPATETVEVGSTVTLTATVLPDNATNKAITWTVESGDTYASVADGVVTGLVAGEAVIRATSVADGTKYAECTVTVNAADPTKHKVTFDATVDQGESPLSKSNITFTCSNGVLNNGSEYRLYKNSTTTFACSAGNIIKIEFTGVSGNPVSGFGDPEVGTLVTEGNDGVWTGNAASVAFVASGAQVRATEIKVTYKEDNRAEAGLAWDPADDIELTVGDAFTAPTLNNPNSIDASAITIESDNTDLAVVNDGVVSLVADATGTAVITASFAGNEDYKPAVVFYTITVNAAAPAPLTDYYEKVTSGDIAEGTYLIVYEAGNVAFDGGADPLDAVENSIAVDIVSGNKIGVTSATEAATFYIDPTAGTIQAASGKYIGQTSDANGLGTSESASTYTNSFSFDEGNAVIVSSSAHLCYNSTSNQLRFRYYKSSSYSSQQPIALYKLANEVIKPASGLAWDPADDIELTVGGAFSAPALLNPNEIPAGDITIESSNTDVATVSEGVVSLVENGIGTTTISATYTGETYKPITVSYKIKVNPAYSIYVDKLNVNFGSVEKDAALPADKTITVTLNNVALATATLGGTNPEVFSIDPATLTESGDITISVVSSATVANYAATLTISDDAGNAESKVVNLSFSVTEPAGEETPVATDSKWVPATEIADGMQVLITGVKSDDVYAMGEQKNNNRAAVAASVDGEGVLTPGENTMAFTLVAQGDGTYALRTSNGKYLYAAASGSNYLKTQDEVDVNAKWTMTVASASAEGSSNRHVMQFNTGSTLFSCYVSAGGSGMAAIKLYVPKPAPAPVEDWVEVRTGLSADRFYTLCYNKTMTDIKGASLWQFLNKDANFAYIVEAEAPYVAGTPYLIYAESDKLEAVVEDVTYPEAGHNNGLYGTFVNMDAAALSTAGATHMLKSNMIKAIGVNNHLDAYRAYIKIGEIPGEAAPAPGRRVKAMPMQPQEATGLDNIFDINADGAQKLILNGQLIIIREGKMYDTTGRVVK